MIYKKFLFTIGILIAGCLFAISLKATAGFASGQSGTKAPPQLYSVYTSFEAMITSAGSKYFEPIRVSSAGSKDKPTYHGFFFYNCSQNELLQFDPSGRFMLGMRIFIEGRKVLPTDKGEIGIFDLNQNNQWTKIGETSAWNWQQGCRLQWIPGSSEEIIWNDRSMDGKALICKIYNTRTKKTRILPFTVYTVSPDGKTILSVNFERIKHGGCDYVGIEDPFKNQWAPGGTGIWKMDINTGKLHMILSVREIAKSLYPDKFPSDTAGGTLYFFREGFNLSGNRFVAFVKDARETGSGVSKVRTEGFSMNLEGKDIRYFYKEPSHHFWLNDDEIIDNGNHLSPDGTETVRGYFRFKDDGTGRAKEKYFDAPNGHITIHRNGNWILTDTYSIGGYVYLYMYHIPSRKFVPLAKLAFELGGKLYTDNPGIFRVDLHPRFSPDGKYISFDSTHEGLGRQIYLMDIRQIINNPPSY
jgi:hypothetical protein